MMNRQQRRTTERLIRQHADHPKYVVPPAGRNLAQVFCAQCRCWVSELSASEWQWAQQDQAFRDRMSQYLNQ